MERLSGGNQRALRDRQEVADGHVRCVPAPVRATIHGGVPGESVWTARQLRSGDLTRHPGDDPEVPGSERERHERSRPLGRRLSHPRIPLRRRLRASPAARGRAIRLQRSGEHRLGRGDLDPRARLAGGRGGWLRRADRLGRVTAEWAAPPAARRVACPRGGAGANILRSGERFGFTATTPLSEGIGRTIEWYRKERMR